jgi:hypothetical protein
MILVAILSSFPNGDRIALTGCIFIVLFSLARSLWMTLQQGWSQVRRLHQIPCPDCIYFTGNYHLKCTVCPSKALNESAIDCRDYEPVTRAIDSGVES